ncbi:MAG: HupE/UreJ family protein [Nevskia sp.]|nr:HupE/UreJ family protein [Nevskia sp.]
MAGPAWLALLCAPAHAHEIRPAYLGITEDAQHHYEVRWKQPAAGEFAVRLVPHLGNGWLEQPPAEEDATPRFVVRVWRPAATGSGIDGQVLSIEGLDRTITDVLVEIRLADGRELRDILNARHSTLTIHAGEGGAPVLSYFGLGVEHILTGIDHLMFVLGLMLLVRERWRLFKAISAFTAAHSITLASAAMGLVHTQPAVIESMVALSIVFLAVELVHAQRGRLGLTVHYPWLIAFSFGLLHGFAFAGALAEVGLPPKAIPLSLLLFNLGVEAGQLLFVAAALVVIALLRRLPRLPAWGRWVPPYAIGSFASFWLIQRLLIIVS